jgi:hypothetical protein
MRVCVVGLGEQGPHRIQASTEVASGVPFPAAAMTFRAAQQSGRIGPSRSKRHRLLLPPFDRAIPTRKVGVRRMPAAQWSLTR